MSLAFLASSAPRPIAYAASSSTSSSSSTISITSTVTTGPNYSVCLVQVPANATIDSNGEFVDFRNGTVGTVPFFSCQRFIHPDDFQTVMAIAADPAFIAAENGSFYAFGGIGGFGYSTVNGTVTCTTLDPEGHPELQGCFVTTSALFTLFSSTETIPGCTPGSTIPRQLGQIQVAIPVNATGSMNLSNLSVGTIPIGALNEVLCTTTTTVSPIITVSQAVTSTLTTQPTNTSTTQSGIPRQFVVPKLYAFALVIIAVFGVLAVFAYLLKAKRPA